MEERTKEGRKGRKKGCFKDAMMAGPWELGNHVLF